MAKTEAGVSNHDTIDALNEATLHHAAERGQAATDKYVHWLPVSVSLALLISTAGTGSLLCATIR